MSKTAASAKPHYLAIRDLAKRSAGVVVGPDKDYLIESRLAKLVAALEIKGVAELDARLRSAPTRELERTIVEALLNGETNFFRDFDCFSALRSDVLPGLIERRRNVKRLDFWSAACSTGQEPYSLAMLLRDHFAELATWKVRILATDLSQAHLERAAAGCYTQFEVNRGLPSAALVRHFDQRDGAWVLEKAIRERVELLQFNLTNDATPIARADVVLLRNVMIYWDMSTKREVLGRVANVLRPGGALVLGAAESTDFLDDRFERFGGSGSCCFRLRGDPEWQSAKGD